MTARGRGFSLCVCAHTCAGLFKDRRVGVASTTAARGCSVSLAIQHLIHNASVCTGFVGPVLPT